MYTAIAIVTIGSIPQSFHEPDCDACGDDADRGYGVGEALDSLEVIGYVANKG